MELGAFSVSLAVRDISASRAFYEKLGFTLFGGDVDQHWLIMKNGQTLIGLFQGMFANNILTFNPGWDSNARDLQEFADIRELQQHFLSQGLSIDEPVDENSKGPASFTIKDPDGNTILIDQHR